MNWNVSKRTIYILLGVSIFSVLVFIGGMRTYFYWTDVHYFGEIVEIKNGGFSIRSDKGAEKLILTDQNTVVRRGRKILERKLQIGDRVIIVGSADQGGAVEARVIRVVNPPPR